MIKKIIFILLLAMQCSAGMKAINFYIDTTNRPARNIIVNAYIAKSSAAIFSEVFISSEDFNIATGTTPKHYNLSVNNLRFNNKEKFADTLINLATSYFTQYKDDILAGYIDIWNCNCDTLGEPEGSKKRLWVK